MKIEIDVDVPPGFEATGEYRRVQAGEWYLRTRYDVGSAANAVADSIEKYLILRRLPPPPQVPTSEHIGHDILVSDNSGLWHVRKLLFINDAGFWCCGDVFPATAHLWKKAKVLSE